MAAGIISMLRQYKNSNNMAQNTPLSKVTFSGITAVDLNNIEQALKDTMKIAEISCADVGAADAEAPVCGVTVKINVQR